MVEISEKRYAELLRLSVIAENIDMWVDTSAPVGEDLTISNIILMNDDEVIERYG